MIIEEILLEDNETDKREKIQANLGREVILNDGHNLWVHGILLTEGSDDQVYQINMFNAIGKRQLHYHDLNQLLVLRHLPEYEPKISK